MNPPTPQAATEIYAVFCGFIDQASAQRLLNAAAMATQNPNVKHLHLLFQSTGGFVGDGICLYNFLRSLSIGVSLYNVGSVQSIATVAYLGAKTRKVSAHATFMIHRSTFTPQMPTADRLQAAAQMLTIDDRRTEDILRKHLTMSDEDWSNLRNNEFWFTAEDALKNGLATEIGEFAPPKGTPIFGF
jgi:ATP-dependent Clp protease protease subunit